MNKSKKNTGKRTGRDNSRYILLLVFLAMLTALSVVLTRFGSITLGYSYRIGFGMLPVMLAGAWFGALPGAAVGAVGDILGVVATVGWNPLLTIPPAVAGLIPPLLLRAVRLSPGKQEKPAVSFGKMFFVILTTKIVTSVVLKTPILAWLYPSNREGFITFLAIRTVIAIGEGLVESVAVYILYTNQPICSMMKKRGIL